MKVLSPHNTERDSSTDYVSRHELPSAQGRQKTSLESRSTSAAGGRMSQGSCGEVRSHGSSQRSAERDLIRELEEQRRINSGLVRRNVALIS